MIPMIIIILILIGLIYIFFQTKPSDIFKLNLTCKKCGAQKGILKCSTCRV